MHSTVTPEPLRQASEGAGAEEAPPQAPRIVEWRKSSPQPRYGGEARPSMARPAAAVEPRAAKRPGWLTVAVGVVVVVAVAAGILVALNPKGLALGRLVQLGAPAPAPTTEPTADVVALPTSAPVAATATTEAATETSAPEPTSTTEAAATTATPLVHTVVAGETLQAIATRYGVSAAEIRAANNLQSDVLQPGQQLVIPGKAANERPATHTVKAGENLLIIAQQYGLTVADLMAANNIEAGDVLKVGQVLKIPGGVEPTPEPPPTEAPTATAEPTLTVAPTETVTATLPAAAPPPPTYTFAAPNLLTPPDNAIIKGAEDILLNWTSVGLLDDNTWYVVSIRREDKTEPSLGWTRTTAWRFPVEQHPKAGEPSRFYWSVTVMRSVEGSVPEPLSPRSEERVFVWE